MKEIYKSKEGFENYLVSNYGNVFSIKSNIILKPSNTNKGYSYINLSKNSIFKKFTNHRLVATAFIPNPENKPQVNHKDGNKQNNCVDNLEWVTQSENQKHAFRIGLRIDKGINHSNHKLSEKEVLTIHGLYLSGLFQKEIGLIYKISHQHVSDIINGKFWNYLLVKEDD